MEQAAFDRLRLELSVNAKNGVDFIVSATVVWLLLGYIWTLPYSAYNRSVLTFMAEASRSRWRLPCPKSSRPAGSLRAIRSKAYAIMAGVISVGALGLGLTLPAEQVHMVPFAMAGALAVLAILLLSAWRTNSRA